jgi:quercetin dioxygenase-like cupin family protein
MTERIARERFPVPVDRDAVARDWAARGYSCGLFTDPPGRVWADFVHGSNELITVLEGCLEVTVGSEYLVANPGDEVFIPKSVVHTVRNLAPTTTRWLYGYD